VWYPAVTKAGLKGLTFHGLRHTGAGLMREAGAHTQVIARRLGHSSERMTTGTYGWVTPETDRAAASALDELLRSSHRGEEKSV